MHASALLLSAIAGGALAISLPWSQQPIVNSRPYAVQTPPLDTNWTYQVGTKPWPQYPRPKLARSEWKSLNGVWMYASASGKGDLSIPPFNQTLPQEVLVPFCLESGLSGIQGENTIYSWYRTTFTVPSKWTGDRVLLNFGAVDYEATVFINGRTATFHRGGYTAFSLDVTDYLNDGENELIVFAFDPTDMDPYVVPTGKQTLHASHIFYRPCSGIWQSVWIESAPSNHISELSIDATASGQVNLTVNASDGKDSSVKVSVYERGSKKVIASHKGAAGSPILFKVKSPKTWSPDSPNLYDFEVKMGKDEVSSYTGFRTVTKQAVNGVQRIILNGDMIFPFGTLDQGYWPDGIYTAPTYEAMTYDIKVLKQLGYNMLRKHVKVEPPLYYAAADELGILIMQDMPCLRPSRGPNEEQQAEFERQLQVIVEQFKGYTSIFSWALYNEGWGQITQSYNPEFALTDIVHKLDPTRLVNAVSGWHDHGAGEFSDNHHYTSPQCGTPFHDNAPFDPERIGFQGEFGGTGHNVSAEHLWKVKRAIDGIGETYEMYHTLDEWNLRSRYILNELRLQVELYSCAGGVWTQTTDVEGELNGMLTYDRRILRTDVEQWKKDIQALYDAAAIRSKVSSKEDSSLKVDL
ncbi:putative beta-galactosidase [Acrodontium crateriforme]|uniref:Beta-galactosidase n=1 Tax=Acrodontium crateriforme TaxID=150365 RepID=A0AAQ3R8J0_9PEZI|nr:putative beta-galactosidase [Acrodontium crateriforme]